MVKANPFDISRLTSSARLKLSMLGERLNITPEDASVLLSSFRADAAAILGVNVASVEIDTEFQGPNADIVLKIHKQNLPRRVG